jgi:hypothetical protein
MTYAMRLSPDVTALHCIDLEGPEAEEHETHLRTTLSPLPDSNRGSP